jgi:hypothetical protein
MKIKKSLVYLYYVPNATRFDESTNTKGGEAKMLIVKYIRNKENPIIMMLRKNVWSERESDSFTY